MKLGTKLLRRKTVYKDEHQAAPRNDVIKKLYKPITTLQQGDNKKNN
jgi:hypothetical protein